MNADKMTKSENDVEVCSPDTPLMKKINSSKKVASKQSNKQNKDYKKLDNQVFVTTTKSSSITAEVTAAACKRRRPKCQPMKIALLTEKERQQTKRHQQQLQRNSIISAGYCVEKEADEKEKEDPLFNCDNLKSDELPLFFKAVNNNKKGQYFDNGIKNINTVNNKSSNKSSKMGDRLGSTLSAKTLTLKTPANKSNKNTPATKKRKAPHESAEITPLKVAKVDMNDTQNSIKRTLPKIEDEIPVLSAQEQIEADNESNVFYPRGARVFAIYGKDYYPAIVDEVDALGRYKIFFTEDHSTRNVPRDGVFPLHYVKENYAVTVISNEKDEQNDERLLYQGKILATPSIKDAQEWQRGLFKIEVQNEDHLEPESREIEWFDIYFTEAQYKQSIKSSKYYTMNNQVSENGLGGRRRTRVSTFPTTPSSRSTSTPTPPILISEKNGNDVTVSEEKKPSSPERKRSMTTSNPGTSTSISTSRSPLKIFESLQFILTSANRESGPRPFAKREVRKQIESRGGNVVETFESMNPELTTYLIADTFYRTHKYLTALSLSVPTVSFKWINKCVEENKLVDYNDFMLDAGESETTGEVYKWQSLKGKILGGKKIAVYSKREIFPSNAPVDFRQIWAPMVVNLGADLVDNYPAEYEKAVEFFKNRHVVDYFVADDGATSQELINAVIEGGAVAVTSEWVIQTVITGVLATTSGDEPYILHPK